MHEVQVSRNSSTAQSTKIVVDGIHFESSELGNNHELVREVGEVGHISVLTDPDKKTGRPRLAWVKGEVHAVEVRLAREVALERALGGESLKSDSGNVVAPMPGRVVQVLVKNKQSVVQGEAIMIIEAMKMENEIHAPCAGTVDELTVRSGDAVEAGYHLCSIRSAKTNES